MTHPYWDGAKEGKLVLHRCQSCKYYNHPPVYICQNCQDRDAILAYEPVSGKGTLHDWYICHDTSIEGFEDKVPYEVITVELDEQPELVIMSKEMAAYVLNANRNAQDNPYAVWRGGPINSVCYKGFARPLHSVTVYGQRDNSA